jgi:hypothetical protein
MQCLIDTKLLYYKLADMDPEERGKYLLIACMEIMSERSDKYDFVVKQPQLVSTVKRKPANRITYESVKGKTSPQFEVFWKLYPRKIGKGAAWLSWKKQPEGQNELLEMCSAALEWQVESSDWKKEHGTFIPHPTTYLNQRRFEDEAPKQTRSSLGDLI